MTNYIFDIEIAQQYGVDEAIFIANLQYWILKNKANEKHFYDGRYWTYNSIDALSKLFPFWSVNQIRRIINSLIEKGVIMKGNFNNSTYDRTLWYAFVDEQKWICGNSQMEIDKTPNPFGKTTKCIVNNNNYNNILLPDNKPNSKKYQKEFDDFWLLYPKQRIGSKEKAYKSFCRAIDEKRTTIENLFESVKRYSESREVKQGYAKGCSAWLNDDRFNNQYEQQKWEW